MDVLVHTASSNKRQWRYVRRLIAQGNPRPTEERLNTLAHYRHVSFAKYFKSLGIPIVLCSAETAKVYPEVLDLLKDYSGDDNGGYGDMIKDAVVDMSEELIVVAATTRLDLRKKLREIVIQEGYADLFQRFRFNITLDEVDIMKSFEGYGAERLRKFAEMFKVPISTFYPAVVSDLFPHTFEDLMSPELLEYCVDHWDETSWNIKRFLRTTLPEELQYGLPPEES